MNAWSSGLSRRGLVLTAGAVWLSACGRKVAPPAPKPAALASSQGLETTIDWAVAGHWRPPADRARDLWRHPVETLHFFGLKPGMTVVEFWPGAGWYSDIIAPFLARTGGKLYAADLVTNNPAAPADAAIVEAYRRKLEANRNLYGDVAITAFGPTTGPVAPAGSADMVLFLRNLHNWMAGGFADKAFHDAYQALKPGGVLGIEEHRAAPAAVQDVLASNGYVQQAYARKLAEEAGFVFDKSSEINANPKDAKDHPFGVWTLPPTRLSAPRGQPANPRFDHAKYDAIGESDRMTLRFVKPRKG